MSSDQLNWEQVLALSQSPQQKIVFALATVALAAEPYKTFVALVDRAIDLVLSDMARNKNIVHEQSEDELSVYLVGVMKGMTFNARHGENNGGHCDITIDGPNDMRWLGEAKKYTSFAKLFGGARQLINRYGTGLPNQDAGALIVYISKPDALGIMKRWRSTLVMKVKGLEAPQPGEQQLDFLTLLTHKGSGRKLTIRHVPAVLFHEPTDVLPYPKDGDPAGLGAH
jgi:hypothetical protein